MIALQKTRIIIVILISLILGGGQISIAQDSSKVSKTKEVKNGGSLRTVVPKKKIPNWKQAEKFKKEIKKKLTKNFPDSAKAVGGFGHANEKDKNSQFKEDKQKLGYPIGWITNSNTPILRKDEKHSYIELNESQQKVYLGKYIKIKPNSKYQLMLSFKNSSNVQLSLKEYDENNKKNSKAQIIELPQGEFQKYEIDIIISPTTENLFIKFEKNANDKFILNDFVCKGVLK